MGASVVSFKSKSVPRAKQEALKKMFHNIVSKRSKFGTRCLIIPKNGKYTEWAYGSAGDLLRSKQMSKTYNLDALAKRLVETFHIYKLVCPSCSEGILITDVNSKGVVTFSHENNSLLTSQNVNMMLSRIFGVDIQGGAESSVEDGCKYGKNNDCIMMLGEMLPWRPIWRML